MLKQTAIFLLIIFAFGSCIPIKKVRYLQLKSKINADSIQHSKFVYRVQPSDVLSIKVLTLVPEINQMFKSESDMSNNQSNVNAMGAYMLGYIVDGEGNVEIPFAGKVMIKGLTLEETKEKIKKVISGYVDQSTIDVKLISFKISVVGEVQRPGMYYVFSDRVNIFEALSLASDINEFGDSRKVKIIRETSKGSVVKMMNLADKNIISDDFYYIMPNDVVYVEPLGIKRFGTRTSLTGTILSALSTLAVILNIVYLRR